MTDFMADCYTSLTKQQYEVVMSMAEDGATDAELAVRFGVSVRTIERHMSCALHRLSLSNRTALAVEVWRSKGA
jgi:DNA-binding NarL/FixJ family response regulator